MDTYSGRLVVQDGHLRAFQATQTGTTTYWLVDEEGDYLLDEDGERREVVEPVFTYGENHLRPVRYDPETDSYVFLLDGERSHNDVHHKQFVAISGTSGPLFDEDGIKVYDGDPHHFFPTPDDPHFDENGGKYKTTTTSHPDSEAPFVSGHTDAYKGLS